MKPYRRGLAATATALMLAAASCKSAPPVETGPAVFFPGPPAAPRVQYLTSANGSGDVTQEKSGLELFALGQDKAPPRTINKPYGCAARDGAVYACDTKSPSIVCMDFKNRAFTVFGDSGLGALQKPINIAIDELGYKFVADTGRAQIVVFDPENEFIRSFDLPQPCHPVDIALHGDELYVLDNDDTCQILVLERTTGEILRSFGEPGQDPGQFHSPSSLTVDPEGYLYVSDTLNYRIQKLTLDGDPIWERGNAGYQLGQFGRPRGIRAGPDGVIYVVEGAMQLVQMFNGEGDVLMRFGGPGQMPGSLTLPASIAVDTTSIPAFEQYFHEDFDVAYLLFVTSQYGDRLVNVYAFGQFPEGYRLGEGEIATIAPRDMTEGIGAVDPGEEIPDLNSPPGGEQDPETDPADPGDPEGPEKTEDGTSGESGTDRTGPGEGGGSEQVGG